MCPGLPAGGERGQIYMGLGQENGGKKVEWKTRERLTGTSFQYQRVGHCQKEVKEYERRKR